MGFSVNSPPRLEPILAGIGSRSRGRALAFDPQMSILRALKKNFPPAGSPRKSPPPAPRPRKGIPGAKTFHTLGAPNETAGLAQIKQLGYTGGCLLFHFPGQPILDCYV